MCPHVPCLVCCVVLLAASFWFSPLPGNQIYLRRVPPVGPGVIGQLRWERVGDPDAYDVRGGALPDMMAAPWYRSDSASAVTSLVRLMGYECAEDTQPRTIDLNDTVRTILERLNNKHVLPGSAAILILPPSSRSHSDDIDTPLSLVAGNTTRCPFSIAAMAVSGVRRSDSLQREPISPNDRWHMSNHVEMLTSLVANMLVEAGRISLTSTVAQIFPYLNGAAPCGCPSGSPQNATGYFQQSAYACGATLHLSWENVTVAHLLTHSDGLISLDASIGSSSALYREVLAMEAASSEPENCTNYPLPSRRFLLRRILPLAIPSSPRAINTAGLVGRSRASMLVLGLILEEVLHQPLETVLQEHVFAPLHMTSAGFGAVAPQIPLAQYADKLYGNPWYQSDIDGKWAIHSTDAMNPKAWQAADGAHATMTDWARWMACQLQEGEDLTAEGFPPLSSPGWPTRTTSPSMLSAERWRLVNSRYWPEDIWTLSAAELESSVTAVPYDAFAAFDGVAGYASAHSIVPPSLTLVTEGDDVQGKLTPFACLVTTNTDSQAGIWEGRAALLWAYMNWIKQRQERRPTVPSSSSSSSTASAALSSPLSLADGWRSVAILALLTAVLLLAALLCYAHVRCEQQHDQREELQQGERHAAEKEEEADEAEAHLSGRSHAAKSGWASFSAWMTGQHVSFAAQVRRMRAASAGAALVQSVTLQEPLLPAPLADPL